MKSKFITAPPGYFAMRSSIGCYQLIDEICPVVGFDVGDMQGNPSIVPRNITPYIIGEESCIVPGDDSQTMAIVYSPAETPATGLYFPSIDDFYDKSVLGFIPYRLIEERAQQIANTYQLATPAGKYNGEPLVEILRRIDKATPLPFAGFSLATINLRIVEIYLELKERAERHKAE